MRCLLALLLLLLAACPAAPPPRGTPPPSGSGGAPPPVTGECATDDDCVVSCAQKDSCCSQLCEPCTQVFTRAALAAHEKWKDDSSCSEAQCPVARCMPPKERTSARCTAGTCTLERAPL